jgi:Zn-dependent protease with chaperone function
MLDHLRLLSTSFSNGWLYNQSNIPGMVLQNTAGFGMVAGFMHFSRNAEAEADKLGTEYLYAAGYDPTALATMFEKLEPRTRRNRVRLRNLYGPSCVGRSSCRLTRVGCTLSEREEYVINTWCSTASKLVS